MACSVYLNFQHSPQYLTPSFLLISLLKICITHVIPHFKTVVNNLYISICNKCMCMYSITSRKENETDVILGNEEGRNSYNGQEI